MLFFEKSTFRRERGNWEEVKKELKPRRREWSEWAFIERSKETSLVFGEKSGTGPTNMLEPRFKEVSSGMREKKSRDIVLSKRFQDRSRVVRLDMEDRQGGRRPGRRLSLRRRTSRWGKVQNIEIVELGGGGQASAGRVVSMRVGS